MPGESCGTDATGRIAPRPRPARTFLALTAVLAPALLAGCLTFVTGEPSEPWPAPDFALVDTDGTPRNLTDYRGQVLVVDLMATWCGPCKKEMPHLKQLRRAYAEEDVALLSVGADTTESNAQLDAFRERYGADWPIARDTDDVAGKLGLRIIPKLVIIDPDGLVVFEHERETYPFAMAKVINRYAEVQPRGR